MPVSRAFTVTTTNDRQNITCAISSVQNPTLPPDPLDTNNASSDAPSTISGVAIGKKITRLVVDRPRNRCRTIANAIIVPSAVAITVASRPIRRLVLTASHSPYGWHGCSQLFQVNPSNV